MPSQPWNRIRFRFTWISCFFFINLFMSIDHFLVVVVVIYFYLSLVYLFLFHVIIHIEYFRMNKKYRCYRRYHRIVHVKFTIWWLNAGNAMKVIGRNSVKFIYFYNEKIWATNQRTCCYTNRQEMKNERNCVHWTTLN